MLENKDEMMLLDTREDDDAFLPDGYSEGDDFFAPDTWTGAQQADESAADEAQVEVEQDTGAETETEEQPTTAETEADGSGGEDHSAEEETQDEAPGQEQEIAALPRKLKFRAKIDHQEQEVELDEEALPATYQKAQVAERLQRKLADATGTIDKAKRAARSAGFDTVEDFLDSFVENYKKGRVDELVAKGTPKEIAEDYVTRMMDREPSVVKTEESPAESVAQTPAEPAKPAVRDFRKEVQDLYDAKPELRGKQLPDEVAHAAARGENLMKAYLAYEAKQEKAENAKLRKENKTLKQNAASAAKAPVKGVSGGGKTDTTATDPFLSGFESEGW